MSGLILCKLNWLTMLPRLSDLVALMGLSLVLCNVVLRVGGPWSIPVLRARWIAALSLVLLWVPVGPAQLPIIAYVRGITADASISLMMLALLGLRQRLLGGLAIDVRERQALYIAIASAAVFLYPLALGWGDWDAYRPGWGSYLMWAGLLMVSLGFAAAGLSLLPALVSLALLAWSIGLLESNNLWDYLQDPWLAAAAICKCFAALWRRVVRRLKPVQSGAASGPDIGAG